MTTSIELPCRGPLRWYPYVKGALKSDIVHRRGVASFATDRLTSNGSIVRCGTPRYRRTEACDRASQFTLPAINFHF